MDCSATPRDLFERRRNVGDARTEMEKLLRPTMCELDDGAQQCYCTICVLLFENK